MSQCTLAKTMNIIGKKWSVLVLFELYKETCNEKRFNALKEGLQKITPKMLSQRLRELEHEGLIVRRLDSSAIPVRTSYSLTKSGLSLVRVVLGFKKWALTWKPAAQGCQSTDCRHCGV